MRHECPHLFRDLCCGEAFEDEFQVGLGFDLVGFGSFHQVKEHGAGVGTLGSADKEPVLAARGQPLSNSNQIIPLKDGAHAYTGMCIT